MVHGWCTSRSLLGSAGAEGCRRSTPAAGKGRRGGRSVWPGCQGRGGNGNPFHRWIGLATGMSLVFFLWLSSECCGEHERQQHHQQENALRTDGDVEVGRLRLPRLWSVAALRAVVGGQSSRRVAATPAVVSVIGHLPFLTSDVPPAANASKAPMTVALMDCAFQCTTGSVEGKILARPDWSVRHHTDYGRTS